MQLAALAVDRAELLGIAIRLLHVVTEQALHANAHVFQSPGGVQARADGKTQVTGAQRRHAALCGVDQGVDTGAGAATADALQTGGDQHAIVEIQRHQIGHRTQRHQVEQRRQIRAGAALPTATGNNRGLISVIRTVAGVQPRPQRQQQIKHHADAGQRLAGKCIAAQIGVHQRIHRWQLRARQMMVGDDHADTQRPGHGHPGHAGHAVVDSDDQLRHWLQRGHQRGGQAVAMNEPVGHGIGHVFRAEHAQPAHGDGGAGRSVAIVITGNHDGPILVDCRDQQIHGLRHAAQRRWRQQAQQAMFNLRWPEHAARGIDLLQHRMYGVRPPAGCALTAPAAQLQHAQRAARRHTRQRCHGRCSQRSPLAKFNASECRATNGSSAGHQCASTSPAATSCRSISRPALT